MQVVGIDLGTTFSAIATLDDRGQPVTLPNRDGEMLTPSAVLLLDDGGAVVGQAALDVALEQPDRVATLIKRRMGLDRLRPARRRPRVPARNALGHHPPQARPGRRAAARAGRQGGHHRARPTSTTPAARPPRTPAASPGWTCSTSSTSRPPRPWPTRSSAATPCRSPHATLTDRPQTVLVYDLGGGTFDVTLVRLSPQRFQALAIEGDVRLGGKDWDDRIVDHVAERVPGAATATTRATDPQSLAVLQAAAERAKRTLSKLDQTSVTCTHAGKVLTRAAHREPSSRR